MNLAAKICRLFPRASCKAPPDPQESPLFRLLDPVQEPSVEILGLHEGYVEATDGDLVLLSSGSPLLSLCLNAPGLSVACKDGTGTIRNLSVHPGQLVSAGTAESRAAHALLARLLAERLFDIGQGLQQAIKAATDLAFGQTMAQEIPKHLKEDSKHPFVPKMKELLEAAAQQAGEASRAVQGKQAQASWKGNFAEGALEKSFQKLSAAGILKKPASQRSQAAADGASERFVEIAQILARSAKAEAIRDSLRERLPRLLGAKPPEAS